MKAQEFVKEVDNSDRGMNKYGLAARNKDGKFYSYSHGKLTGTFDNIQDLQKHQQELIKNESIKEGADFLGYKFNADTKTWEFPDGFKQQTGHLSNHSVREILDALGLDSNFEDAGPIEIDKFINISTGWLKKNLDKPSADVPTTVDKSGGGATMISGGRPEGCINRMVMTFNKEARRIKQAHPDLTHVAFA